MVADLFHHGHVLFLQRARALGDYLIVGIHADDVVTFYKRRPILTMEERVKAVIRCRCVDQVIPNAPLVVDRTWIAGDALGRFRVARRGAAYGRDPANTERPHRDLELPGNISGAGQYGSALRSGRRGPEFKSRLPDQTTMGPGRFRLGLFAFVDYREAAAIDYRKICLRGRGRLHQWSALIRDAIRRQ